VQAIRDIRKVVSIIHPTQKLQVVRDVDDGKIMDCAIEAQADLIPSFDKDLLVLEEYAGIQIIHPTMLQHLFPSQV
jgi:predicted nucleic acid-binding protein